MTPTDNAALRSLIVDVGPTPGSEAAEPFLADLTGAQPEVAALLSQPEIAHLATRIFVCAPYLRNLILRNPGLLSRTLTEPLEDLTDQLIASASSRSNHATQEDLMRDLRRCKQQIALLVALADIGGVWSVMKVTDTLTRFADAACQSALSFAFHASQGGKRTARERAAAALSPVQDATERRSVDSSGLFVIAMGKHGAYELNYSSDIDLIIFYNPLAQPDVPPQQQRDEAIDTARLFVKLMQEQTQDGYVFRTDLRLRPDPGSTPIAMSTDAAFQYYESFGQNWERAAFIKARPIAGDITAGREFLSELQPYIWRRHLDHAAIRDIHAMKRQIATHHAFSGIDVPGHNVKLGPGGIREIEFFAQTKQLTAGGRQPELRVPATLLALDELTQAGWIEQQQNATLHAAYEYLRMVEHRLQMVADAQTHTIPGAGPDLDNIAIFCGANSTSAFLEHTREILVSVREADQDLFAHADDSLAADIGPLSFTGSDPDAATLETLTSLGFQEPVAVIDLVKGWHFGRIRATRTEKARVALTDLQPKLIQALAATDTPDAGLRAFDRALGEVGNGIQFFASLNQNPSLLRLLAEILGTAPRLADLVAHHPHMLDALLDPTFFGEDFSKTSCVENVASQMDQAAGFEDLLDRARITVHEQQFLIGTRLLSNTIDPADAAIGYACLADAAVLRLFSACEELMVERHGSVPGGEAAVLAMGSWGAREMHAASDIDLIMIYDVPADASGSDGPRPLSVTEYYTRLTKRLITAVSAQLPTGTLYEIDTRLRPSGNSGPLATSLSGFIKYQSESAWTWEHMALTRARVLERGTSLDRNLAAANIEVIAKQRDEATIAADVRDMRQRLHDEKGTANPWDIKQRAGGLVDIQFIVQYLQLLNAHRSTKLTANSTRDLLPGLQELNLLTPAQAQTLIAANRLYEALIQMTQLCLSGDFSPDTLPAGFARKLVDHLELTSISELAETLDTTAGQVRSIYSEILGS